MAEQGIAGAVLDISVQQPIINGAHRSKHNSTVSTADAGPGAAERTVDRCAICIASTFEVICSAAEVAQHFHYLDNFHRQRLRRAARDHDELIDRADFTQNYLTDIVRCGGCGHVYRRRQPEPQAAASTYAHDHYGSERLAALFEAQLELFRPRAARLAAMLEPATPSPLVIEIGSFVGGFLMAAQERGWRAIGIDPGREVAELCNRKGLTVLQSPATQAEVAPASVDALCIWNTFDQLPDPHAILTSITGWLKPQAVVAIRVPNGACFAACMRALHALPRPADHPLRVAMAWNNFLAFPYLHGYSPETLDRILAPFALQRIAFHPSVLPRLADDRTKPWAVFEEQCVKILWRALTRYDGRAAPWFDAYYRYVPRAAAR